MVHFVEKMVTCSIYVTKFARGIDKSSTGAPTLLIMSGQDNQSLDLVSKPLVWLLMVAFLIAGVALKSVSCP
jgi:hypothetical protein